MTPNDGTVDGPTGVSSFVDVTDNTAPDAPVIEPIDPFRNETTVELEGTCEADCDMTFYCADQTFAWQEYTTCASNGTFYHNLGNLLTPGYNTSCYATCTDSAANESGASNQVMTEACLTVDPYENSLGDGDSATYAIDNWATLPDDNSVTAVVVGNILEESSVWDSDWYKFDTSDDVTADMIAGENNFNFQVQLAQGAGTYSFLVYRGGSNPSSDLECPGQVNSGYTEYSFFAQDNGDGNHSPPANTKECGPSAADPLHNICEDLSDVYYIEIIRDLSAVPSCPLRAADYKRRTLIRMTSPTVRVVAAAILNDGRLLAVRRGPTMSSPGFWEFPGGKVEEGETDEEALAREIMEELRLQVVVGPKLAETSDGRLEIALFDCAIQAGELCLLEHSESLWLVDGDLDNPEWAPMDLPLVEAAKRYYQGHLNSKGT